jgi:hypothetical protein
MLVAFAAFGQGTFVFDQQSNTDETPPRYGSGVPIQTFAPYGQSVTPSLQAVGFIQLKLNDGSPGDGRGATLYVNLRTDSIADPILGTTTPVTMLDLFTGTASFFFLNDVQVTPGLTYFFEPVVQSGGNWNIDAWEYNYEGGMVFYNGGLPASGSDVWFREGLFVPEPASALLVVVGVGAFLFVRQSRQRR